MHYNSTRVCLALKEFARTVIPCILVVIIANAIISYFAQVMIARRTEQLDVEMFDKDLTSLLVVLDDGLLQTRDVDFGNVRKQLSWNLFEIKASEGTETFSSLDESYNVFMANAVREMRALKTGDVVAARSIALSRTNPSLAALRSKIEALRKESDQQAILWQDITAGSSIFTIFAATLAAATGSRRYQIKAQALRVLDLERQSAETGERRFKSLIQNNSDLIAVTSPDGTLKLVSEASVGVWGLAPSSVLGRSVLDFLVASEIPRVRRIFEELISTADPVQAVELQMPDGQGTLRDYQLRITNLMHDPDVAGILWTFHDLTERKKFEQELNHHAFHDGLTGLPNRALFLDRLSQRSKARGHVSQGFAVLFIDLDNFKVINDSLGHAAGDSLLVTMAGRLQSAVRPSDTVARLGGDEFTILLDEAPDSEAAFEVARRILFVLGDPITLSNRQVYVNASIGIAMSLDSDLDAGLMLRHADTAMYQAKTKGKSGFTLFTPAMSHDAVDRFEMESDLRQAVAEGQLFLNYQPIIDMVTGRIVEVEALVRWNHPTRGIVPPLSFIPLAEESGLICEIGHWVLREACSQLQRWKNGCPACGHLRMGVNVSPRQLQEADFVESIRTVTAEFGLSPSDLNLEITETSMLKDLKQIRDSFDRLRKMGVRVAIDDFGTGYSSMSYLSELPVDTLKIDRSFVKPLSLEGGNPGVIQAMITMARTLGLEITSEGIETGDQLEVLRSMGCDLGQGFFFSKPVDGAAVERLLMEKTVALPTASLL